MTYINETFRTYMEIELREKIAQEIEGLIDNQLNLIEENNMIRKCSRIARGYK